MTDTATQLREAVYATLDDLNAQRPASERLAKALDTPLSGANGALDSLAFVNFIVMLEQRLDGSLAMPVSLLDDERLDPTAPHFQTVGNLITYLAALRANA